MVTEIGMRGWTFEMCKMFGNCGYLNKGPFKWQCVNIPVYAVEVAKKIVWWHPIALGQTTKVLPTLQYRWTGFCCTVLMAYCLKLWIYRCLIPC